MHIVINAALLNTEASYRGAGVSRYSESLLRSLSALQTDAPGHRVAALVRQGDPFARESALPGIRVQPVPFPLHRATVRVLWEQTDLPRRLWSMGADLVHGLVNVLPLATRVPGVVTVHDLSFIDMPQTMPKTRRLYLTRLCAASVARARRVIAVSQQTADDLMRHFGTRADKISVIYNGVDARFGTVAPHDTSALHMPLAAGTRVPERFLLYVGTLEPRKNLVRLVQAYAQWRTRAGDDFADVRLVLGGSQGWFFQQIFDCVSALGLEEQVLFPGFIPDADLPQWYRAAQALVYPSLHEGFGLPVLEAMACGTPVVCSNIPSLREVAGDSAVRVDPHDVDALAAGIALVMEQPALGAELSQRGPSRAARFSWQRTARETLHVYEDVLNL